LAAEKNWMSHSVLNP